MRFNRTVLIFVVTTSILFGCSSTEEKDKNLLADQNGENDASTSGYSDGSSVSGEQFGENGSGGRNGLGAEFSDPANPLSKKVIYFMYDSSQVKQEFVSVIAAHSQYLMNHPSQHVVLEGHADERGSREYNIALGEQRAKAVLRMMKMQGVYENQLEVVSYGEEKPDADGMDGSAWQLNRRVEVLYEGQ
jgi:peptidoglycan-associated lipoprotein